MDPWTAFALGLLVGIVLALVVGAILWHLLPVATDYDGLYRQHRLEQQVAMWKTMALIDLEVPDVPDVFSKKVPNLRAVK